MPINFENFENNIINYFDSFLANDESDAASFIARVYEINVKTGQDNNYGNIVQTFNKPILEQSLKSAFEIARTARKSDHFSSMISSGLIGFWTGAQLSFFIPPPGSIQVVSNLVSFPGNPQVINVQFTESNEKFAKDIVRIFKLHMLSLQGVTVSLVPQPTSPPVPITFPWVGYQ